MVVIRGGVTSYDVKENKVDVSPVLSMIQLPDTPLLNQIGISYKPVSATRYEWWDDVAPVLKVPLTAAYTKADGILTVSNGAKLKVGNIVKVESSVYRITSITGNNLSVSVISDDADHPQGKDVEIIGDANPEAQEYTDSTYEQKIKRYNVTQIFTEYLKFSGTQMAVQQYVNEDVFLDEVQKKIALMKVLLERNAWLGVRVDPSDNSTPRLFGGIKWFIDQEGITVSAQFNEENFNAFLKQIYDANGTIREAWMNPATQAYFNALNSDKIIVDRGDTTVGRLVTAYLSNYGTLAIRTTPHLPEGMIVVFDTTKVAVKPLRNRQASYEELAKTGDLVKGQIVGEYTLEFRNPDVAGIFYVQ